MQAEMQNYSTVSFSTNRIRQGGKRRCWVNGKARNLKACKPEMFNLDKILLQQLSDYMT